MQAALNSPCSDPPNRGCIVIPKQIPTNFATNCALLCSLMSFNNTVVAPHTFLRKDNVRWALGAVGWERSIRPGLSCMYMIPLIPFGLFYTFSLQHFWQFQLFPCNVTIMLTMYCAVRFILPNELQLLHARANASPNSQVYCTNVSILSCHTCHTIN